MTSLSTEPEKSLAQNKSERYVRPVNELWEMWKPRVKMRIYPFTYALYDDMERVMTSLTSYDRDSWAAAFSSVAKPYEAKQTKRKKQAIHKAPKKTIFEHTSITGSLGTRQLTRKEKRKPTESHRKCSLRLHVTSTFQ